MAALTGVEIPWTENNALLDIDYIYRWSGYKSISPLVKHLLGNDSEMSAAGYNTLAGIIWAHFGTPWTRMYDALVAEYEPLENYRLTEVENTDISDDGSDRTTGSSTDNTSSSRVTHNVYGYNGSSYVPQDYNQNDMEYNTDLTVEHDNDRDIDRTLTRYGNIGVTTSQQMLESELNLRVYRFFERVYKDVDSIVSLPIYDGEIAGEIYGNTSGGSGVSVTSVNGKTGEVTLYGSDIDLTSLISTTVAQAIANLNEDKKNKPVVLSSTIPAHETSVTFINAAIGDNSDILIFFNRSDAKITSWSQTGTHFEITIQDNANPVKVTLEVYN